MEGPEDEIRRMDIFQTMSLVRTRDLLPLANQLVWERLVQLGLYEGNPNPEVPPEYRYTRSKILSMERDTDNFVESLGLLPQVKQMVIDSQKIQFSDLPPEILVNILGRVSPTAREGALVSRDMKELADIALMDNIRDNNLVDPTIGMPGRGEYFKLDAAGNGDYFAPQPGLWKNFKEFRTTDVDDMISVTRDYRGREYPLVPVLIYGSFQGSEFGDDSPAKLGLSYGTNKFVSLGYTSHNFRRSRMFRTVINGSDPKQILPPADIGPVPIGLHDNRINLRDVRMGRPISNYLNNYQPYEAYIEIGMWITDNRVPVQLIILDKTAVDRAELILPSLRDDVVVI